MAQPLRILVMADTHDHLPPRLAQLAADVDEIWHLGDVCAPALLESIRALGLPFSLVRGNCDSEPAWPMQLNLERNGLWFRLVHIPPQRPPEKIDVLLHGHTHVPRNERVGQVLFLNPGCVTRPNRGAPASVAYLDLAADGKINWRLQLTR
ncbi:MAG: YfcE family phosphodiesterase [Verrucomicrobiota bacterium]|nr:YfcE family phosphodiesterase [Verrucomicrobiota bacterium]